jgi:glutathione peroxidase
VTGEGRRIAGQGADNDAGTPNRRPPPSIQARRRVATLGAMIDCNSLPARPRRPARLKEHEMTKRGTLGLAIATTVAILAAVLAPRMATSASGGRMTTRSVHDFTMKTIDGRDRPLSLYKGKTLLVVNTASKCGFTPQYKGLEALYEKYRDRGFEVLAFPANNFMGQEPGTNEEIAKFCELNYKTSFPLFAKISVKGKDIAPLYSYLTRESGYTGDIGWNFTKFLVDPDGKVVARYDSRTDPLDAKLVGRLEELLAAKKP